MELIAVSAAKLDLLSCCCWNGRLLRYDVRPHAVISLIDEGVTFSVFDEIRLRHRRYP